MVRNAVAALGGHVWTVGVHLATVVRAPKPPTWQRWATRISSGEGETVTLSGAYAPADGSDTIVVIVHGLGGCADSPYAQTAAMAVASRGYSSLRLNLRGADRTGEDVYHAGLAEDVAAAMKSPEVKRYRRRFLIGYSMGGHVSLHAVANNADIATAVAAVCAPLDLDAGARHLDHPLRSVYRQHVLSGLREIYDAAAARGRVHEVPEAKRIRSIRQWDERVIAPRFGFHSAADYYRRASAGPRLAEIAAPTLFMATRFDPMVAAHTLEPHLRRASSSVEVRWLERGGHLGYPPGVRPDETVLNWLEGAAER